MKMQKHILLMALMILAFEGCKKDDPAPALALVGSWKQVSMVSTGCTDPDENGTYNCTTPDCEILLFTATTLSVDGDVPANYTVSGNTLTVDGEALTFAISGTTLTVTFQDDLANGGCHLVITYKKV
jgi:hypothetical protein